MSNPPIDPTVPALAAGPFVVLLAATWAAAALMVAGAMRLGVIDHPGHRSSHTRPTPKGGGIGIVLAFVAAVPVARLLGGLPPLDGPVAGLLGATILLGGVSWLDDVHQWPPVLKLAAQFAAAILVVATGPYPHGALSPIVGDVPGAVLGGVLSVLGLVYLTNAVNFMDGLNGLISGAVMLACLVLGGLMLGGPMLGGPILGGMGLGAMALILAAALAGFLPFNFPAGRIFMGDVGSQSCGLLIGAFGLACAAGQPAGAAWSAVPLMLAGVLYDVTYTLVRRWRRGARLMESHREHLYQLATTGGLSPVAVTLVQWGFVLWGGGIALLVTRGRLATVTAMGLVLLPQLGWTWLVRHRLRRAASRA